MKLNHFKLEVDAERNLIYFVHKSSAKHASGGSRNCRLSAGEVWNCNACSSSGSIVFQVI